MSYLRKCPGCKTNFKALRSNHKWCSVACSERTRRKARVCKWSALVGNVSTGCGEFLVILTGVPRVCPFCRRDVVDARIESAPGPENKEPPI